MTKLEELWNTFPVRRPATSDLIRTARTAATARRRRLVLRPVAFGGVAAAMATAFVLGSLTSPSPNVASPGVTRADSADGGGTGSLGIGSDVSPVSFVTGLRAAPTCDALLDSYRKRGAREVTSWGWLGDGWDYATATSAVGGLADLSGRAFYSTKSHSPNSVSGATSSDTGTNVQEAGVDEPDIAKTSGRLLVRVIDGGMEVFDLSGSAPKEVATVALKGLTGTQLLLSDSTVVAVGTDRFSSNTRARHSGSRVIVVSLAKPSDPKITRTLTFSGTNLTARQTGNTIRLVASNGAPDLVFVQPSKQVSTKAALARNKAIVAASTLEDWLPTYDDGSGPRRLLECDQIAIPDAEMPVGTVAVTGFSADEPDRLSSVGIATTTDLTYQSPDRLYLAGQQTLFFNDCPACSLKRSPFRPQTTPLYAFELDGITAHHIASGEVPGHLRDRWSMDAVGDTLRLALTNQRGNATNVVTLRASGTTLAQLGHLNGIGKNEELQAVRWFDDLALLVTYRQTDPLFAIDLSTPAKPRELSRLKAPGYSAYLHPLDSTHVLGVGVRARGGAKATLFDVSNLASIREASVVRFARSTEATSNWDPHGFTWLPDRQIALATLGQTNPTSGTAGAALAVITVGPDGLSATTVPLDASGTPDQVRTLPGADGKVVLVTPQEVTFLSLPS